jgi:lysophospholipase L1-like esterase
LAGYSGAFHPTAEGQAAIADALYKRLIDQLRQGQ